MNEENELLYPIPENVIIDYEFIPGFGWFEGIVTGVVGIIGVISFLILQGIIPFVIGLIIMVSVSIASTIYSKFDTFISPLTIIGSVAVIVGSLLHPPVYANIIAILGPTLFTFNYVKRDPVQGFSMYKHGKIKREFKKSQKSYPYRREEI